LDAPRCLTIDQYLRYMTAETENEADNLGIEIIWVSVCSGLCSDGEKWKFLGHPDGFDHVRLKQSRSPPVWSGRSP
jgi:hypothetical protein